MKPHILIPCTITCAVCENQTQAMIRQSGILTGKAFDASPVQELALEDAKTTWTIDAFGVPVCSQKCLKKQAADKKRSSKLARHF